MNWNEVYERATAYTVFLDNLVINAKRMPSTNNWMTIASYAEMLAELAMKADEKSRFGWGYKYVVALDEEPKEYERISDMVKDLNENTIYKVKMDIGHGFMLEVKDSVMYKFFANKGKVFTGVVLGGKWDGKRITISRVKAGM